MTFDRAWLTDLLSAIVLAVIVGALVAQAGGPFWASVGFAWIVYLRAPTRAQLRRKQERGR